MTSPYYLAMAALLGLVTTSSPLIGAAIGLHAPFSKRPLACLLAFAAGSLISALAIELAYEGAQSLHHQGFSARTAWAFVSTGFAAGAVIYYFASLFLEKRGAAVRYVTQFREFALARKHADTSERIRLLSSSDLMRHRPICRQRTSSRSWRASAERGWRTEKSCSAPATKPTRCTSWRKARWKF
ncbi:hypothetical protein [Bradyrhizobium barranii]